MGEFVAEMEFYGKLLRVKAPSEKSLILAIAQKEVGHFSRAFLWSVWSGLWLWLLLTHVDAHDFMDHVLALVSVSPLMAPVGLIVSDVFIAFKWRAKGRQLIRDHVAATRAQEA